MPYYDKIDVSEGIHINKISASKECDICHYCYFLNYCFTLQLNISKRLLMMSVNLIYIAILNIKGSNYCCIINLINNNEAIGLMQKDTDLAKKSGTL